MILTSIYTEKRTIVSWFNATFVLSDIFFFSMAQQPVGGQGRLIIEDSQSHLETPHSVGLLWANDQPVAETSTWQYTTLTSDRNPCLEPDVPYFHLLYLFLYKFSCRCFECGLQTFLTLHLMFWVWLTDIPDITSHVYFALHRSFQKICPIPTPCVTFIAQWMFSVKGRHRLVQISSLRTTAFRLSMADCSVFSQPSSMHGVRLQCFFLFFQ